MVFWEAIGHGDKAKSGVAGESGLDIGVEDETAVGEFGEEHRDVEFVEAEKLGKLEHRVHMALHW